MSQHDFNSVVKNKTLAPIMFFVLHSKVSMIQCPKLGKFLTCHSRISYKSWSVTGDSAVLRISEQFLAILVGFDQQTGTNFVHWYEL